MTIRQLRLLKDKKSIWEVPDGKCMIHTINSHSYVVAADDPDFEKALLEADVLIPDGIGIVKACKWLNPDQAPQERVAGADLFAAEMEKLEKRGGKCFFLGSSPAVLGAIARRVAKEYPHITVDSYSPPYKNEFSEEDNRAMIAAVNSANPDLLWVGMTAPKQEKWLHKNWSRLDIHCHAGAIGAVFDFYAGTLKRAPQWWIRHNLEWLYRLIREPGRMWRRYLVSGPRFIWMVCREKLRRDTH